MESNFHATSPVRRTTCLEKCRAALPHRTLDTCRFNDDVDDEDDDVDSGMTLKNMLTRCSHAEFALAAFTVFLLVRFCSRHLSFRRILLCSDFASELLARARILAGAHINANVIHRGIRPATQRSTTNFESNVIHLADIANSGMICED